MVYEVFSVAILVAFYLKFFVIVAAFEGTGRNTDGACLALLKGPKKRSECIPHDSRTLELSPG